VKSIINTFIHQDFKEGVSYYDIAILVTESITFSRWIGPICLPDSPSDDNDKYKNDYVELTGWGASYSGGSVSNSLKRVVLKIFPLR